ncbi:MAG: putative N-formylglutamate amidohydrolase [Tardiphaga sp.]|nr:putative N-formylglutamate amidohydrolase [Tardiphaga sp.]
MVLNMAQDTSLRLELAEVPPVHDENVAGHSPFLLTCDHYGRRIPRALRDLGVAPSELTRHIAWDVGIAGVADRLSMLLDARLIAQVYSRLVIDCNRPFTSSGSIPVLSEATDIPGNVGLSAADIALRRDLIFAPYHRRIAEVLDARARAGRPTVLIALHSFAPTYAGVKRPWHIGTLYHRDHRLPSLLLAALRAEGDLVVGDNEPYAVDEATDYAIPVHGEGRGLIHTGLEIRQDLISDATGETQWAERLARIFKAIEAMLRAERMV